MDMKIKESRSQNILDKMLEGCQIIGYDYGYIYVNDVVVNHSRKTKEELLGHTMMEIYPGIEKTEMFSWVKHCLEDRVAHRMVNEFTYPDGQKEWFDLSIQPIQEGIFILSIDITEQMKAENELKKINAGLEKKIEERTLELRRTAERYKILFNKGNDAIMVTEILENGFLGKFSEVNDVTCSILGYAREELLSMTPDEISVFDEYKIKDRFSIYKEIEKTNGILRRNLYAKDKRIIPVEIERTCF